MFRSFAKFAAVAVLALSAPLFTGCDSDEPTTGDDQNVTDAAGKFETFKGADGKFYFHLLAANGEKVLKSQAYSSKQNATKGVESVKTNGAASKNYKVLKASNGEYYFNLVAANGEIIGTSETYSTKSNATKGRDGVKTLVIKELRIEAAKTGGAKFSTFTGNDGDTYFNLRAGNGEIVLQSEGYENKAGALGAIESVRENGRVLEQFEIIETSSDQAFFHLLAGNGEIIAVSEVYASVDNAERAVESIIDLVESEKIADPK
jgi:uncharacterized protein